MNLEEKPTMTSKASSQAEHLYYVRCSICNTILAVGIPLKRMLDTVTVKCGHCGNLSFLTTSPPLQGHVSLTLQMQSFGGSEYKKGSSSSSSSSTSSDQPPPPTPPFVVKRMRYNASKVLIRKYHIVKLSVLLPKIGLSTYPTLLLPLLPEATTSMAWGSVRRSEIPGGKKPKINKRMHVCE